MLSDRSVVFTSNGAAVRLPSPLEIARRETALRKKFYLVRIGGNDGVGEVWRCRGADGKSGCGGKHSYLTLNCIEQPFSGATDGLYAYWHTVKETGADKMMQPGSPNWLRFQELSQKLGLTSTPDLATTHPGIVRSLTADLSRRDAIRGSIGLGLLVEISASEARMRMDAINARGCNPPFRLEGLEN